MWIVEGDERWRNDVTCALNVDIVGIRVMDAQDMRGSVEGVAGDARFLEFAEGKSASAGRDGFGDEGQAQNFRGVLVEGGVGDRAAAIGDFCYGREAAEKMGFFGRGPLGDGPEGVH